MSMIDGEPRFATCFPLEQSILAAGGWMELALMLSRRLRETSDRLIVHLDRQQELKEQVRGLGFV